MSLYQDKVRDVLANAVEYHQAYYKAETFRGPSLYFHLRAVETRRSLGDVNHIEYVYAALASWGMHRMGRGGSKMQNFDIFRRSIESLQDLISEAQRFEFKEMEERKWTILENIFQRIKVMASGTSLVGNSKVMHHMIPNIVPPIDREYTLRYLRENTNIQNDLAREWQIMREIIQDFFIPLACNRELGYKASQWMANKDEFPWDTSILKVVDNLVIGSRK